MGQIEKRIQGWDETAASYDRRTAWIERRFMAPTRPWIADRAKGETLELAIGTGANLPYYETGMTVVGVDWSHQMLGQARRKADDLGMEVSLIQADATELPIESQSFDTVIASFAMCSLPPESLAEAYRVLRPGGRLLLADHVAAHWPLRIIQHMLNLVTVPLHGEYWTRRPSKQLPDLGFEVVETSRRYFGGIETVYARV